MKKDPVVERIRKIKREIAKRFNYDIHEFTKYIIQKQRESKDKVVNTLKVVKE